jgi:glycosyltransferase involved in cell wall biosynthesis
VIGHNERKHAAITIRSILDQLVDVSFEVIFVDDGSTDDTAATVLAASPNDARVRLVQLADNQGRGAARAAGVAAARGSLIACVDADISLPVDWLRRCLDAIPGYAAVGGIPVPDGDVAVIARISGATARVVPPRMPVAGSNALFRAAVLRESGFDPRDRLGEDFRLAQRLLRDGQRLLRVPGLTVRHEEDRSYARALRWRFDNGRDAASHLVEFRVFRPADAAWLVCLFGTLLGVIGGVLLSTWWLLLGPVAIAAAAVAHVGSRFETRPLGAFLISWLANVPLMASYVIGRTVGIPRLFQPPDPEA